MIDPRRLRAPGVRSGWALALFGVMSGVPARAGVLGSVVIQGSEWLIPAIIVLAAGGGAWLAGRRAGKRIERETKQLRAVLEFADCLLWEATVELKGEDWAWRFKLQPTGLSRRLLEGLQPPETAGLWRQFDIVERAEIDARCREALRTGESGYEQQFHFLHDGRAMWVRESVSVTRVAPNLFWLVGLVTDITAQREAELARQASEDRAQQLLARADCMLWQARVMADEQGGFRWECFIPQSELYRRIAGDQPAPPQRPWEPALVPEYRALEVRARTAMLAGEESYEQEYRVVREGQVWWMREQVAVRSLAANEWTLEGVIVDITAQRQAEESKQASEAQLQGVVNAADFLLWHARVFRRANGQLQWVLNVPGSTLYRRLFGREPAGPAVLPWAELVAPASHEEMVARATQAISESRDGYEQEFHVQGVEREFWLHEQATVRPVVEGEWQLVGVVTDVTARHRAEEARQVSERALREILARADCLVWVGRVEFVEGEPDWEFTIQPSGLCEMLFGTRTPPEEVGLWQQFEIPERVEMDRCCLEALASGRAGYSQVFHIMRNGRAIWLRENVSIRETGRQRYSLVGVVTDITAQHQAEEARQASEVALREILERADCLLWRATVLRENGRLSWVHFDLPASRLCTELLGGGPAAHATQLWDEAGVPELAQMTAHSQYALLSGAPGYEQEFRVMRNERTFWVHERVSITPVRQDEWRVVGVVTDVTVRHEAQEARRRSEARLEELLQRADCLIWQGRVTKVQESGFKWDLYVPRSQLHRRIFGRDPDDRQFDWQELGVPEFPEMRQRAREALAEGAPGYEQTFHIPRPDGDIWVTEQVTIRPVGEKVWEVVGIITDITARHEAEEARRKTEAQLRQILELADCMVWDANVAERVDGGIDWKTYMPRSVLYRRLFGESPGETDFDWSRLKIPEIEEMHRRSQEAIRLRASGYEQEFRVIFQSSVVWLHEVVTITTLAEGRFRLVGVITDITAQREAQEAHKASEAQLEQMLATVDCLLWQARVFALPNRTLRWVLFIPRSRLYREIFGSDPGKEPYLRWEKVVDDATNTELDRRAIEALFGGEENYEQEFRAGRAGREFWLHEQVTITPTGPGEWKLVGVITDLTARREAEQAVRESELRYRTLFQHTPVVIAELDFSEVGRWLDEVRARGVTDLAAELDRDGKLLLQGARAVHFVDCNSTAMATLRAKAKSDFQRRRGMLGTPDSLRLIRSAMLALWEGRNTLEAEIEMRDFAGGLHQMHVRWWMEIAAGRLDLHQSVMVFVDLTELRRAEAALAGEKERLAVTLRAMAEGVVTTDVEGRVQFLNPAAAAFMQQDLAGAIDQPVGKICRLENERTGERVEVPVGHVVKADAVVDLPAQTRLVAAGRTRLVEGCCAPIHAANSAVIGTVLVLRDVTEAARLEQELLRASKLESVGLLAGGIAHDFNNILTAVMGNIALALLDVNGTSEAGRSLREAEKATLRARDLTQQLLTFAKGGEPVRAAVQLDGLVREITEFTLHGSRVRAVFDVAEHLWPADADKGQIGRVVQNLVLNAVQAMPEGGTVRIALRNERLDGLARPALPPGDYVHIAIADSGVGIKPEHLSRIFDPYFTTKQTGSGLGLAAVYSIVNKHRGAIEVDSRLGSGTTFRLWLPALPQSLPEVEKNGGAPAVRPAALKGRVLFMDDEDAIRDMAVFLLKRFGFDVVCAADGSEAVLRYAEARAAGDPFALVIMDLTVPGGMGGREAIGKLREIDPQVRAIVSSGYSSDPVLANFRQHGFSGVVAKPYEVNELARVLREVMAEK